jgi:hypothetical protein
MKMISTRNFSFDGDHLPDSCGVYAGVAVAGQRRRL